MFNNNVLHMGPVAGSGLGLSLRSETETEIMVSPGVLWSSVCRVHFWPHFNDLCDILVVCVRGIRSMAKLN